MMSSQSSMIQREISMDISSSNDVVVKKKVRFGSKDDYVADVIEKVATRDKVEIIGKVEEVDIGSNHDAGDITHNDLDHIDKSDRTVLSPKDVIEVEDKTVCETSVNEAG